MHASKMSQLQVSASVTAFTERNSRSGRGLYKYFAHFMRLMQSEIDMFKSLHCLASVTRKTECP
jgi:hypothetical protein